MKVDAKEAILFAISRYDYAYALKLAERAGKSTHSDLFRLLRALAERRELNIQSIMNLKLEITGMNPADFQLFIILERLAMTVGSLKRCEILIILSCKISIRKARSTLLA